jgi:hypothetical protein
MSSLDTDIIHNRRRFDRAPAALPAWTSGEKTDDPFASCIATLELGLGIQVGKRRNACDSTACGARAFDPLDARAQPPTHACPPA